MNDGIKKTNEDFRNKIMEASKKAKENFNASIDKTIDDEINKNNEELLKMFPELAKVLKKESYDLDEAIEIVDDYFEENAKDRKKQKILDNQDELKKNIGKISSDLKKMVVSNASGYKIKLKDSKFYKNHEDHKEEHYLLVYSIIPKDENEEKNVSKILKSIGDKTEKEFKKDKKDFLSKGLYFDNEKKDDNIRYVELHYDFY